MEHSSHKITMSSPISKSAGSLTEPPGDSLSHWEERSAHRVLESGRDQILERSRKIVDAAYELLDEEGLDGLTIRAVLEKTGLSRRAFYERFEGKDDLVLAVFEYGIRRAANGLEELVSTNADPMERLRIIVTSIVCGNTTLAQPAGRPSNRRGAALSREHLRLAESRPTELQVALGPLLDVITQQLSAAMRAGTVRGGDPRRMATLVYNLVSTTVHTELLAQESEQPDLGQRAELAAEIWEFCRRAVTM